MNPNFLEWLGKQKYAYHYYLNKWIIFRAQQWSSQQWTWDQINNMIAQNYNLKKYEQRI